MAMLTHFPILFAIATKQIVPTDNMQAISVIKGLNLVT